MTPDVDDLVIGSGLLGAIVARRLSERGRRVAIVERGSAVTSPPGAHLRNAAGAAADPDGFFALGAQYQTFYDEQAPDEALPGAYWTSIVGGSGILWTNNCPRAVAGVDLPDELSTGEWERCYTQAERYLGVRTDLFDDSFRARAVGQRLAWPLAAQHRSLVPLPLSGSRAGPEHIHYVASVDVLAGGPDVEIVHGEVTRLEHENARVTGVEVDGVLQSATNVVLAAGAIETPRILWRSGVRPEALGRFLSYHQVLIAQIVLADGLWEPDDPDPLPRLGIPPTRERPWFTMVLRDTYPFPADEPDRDVPGGRLIELQAFCPIDVRPDNALTFGRDGDAAFRIPLTAADQARMWAVEDDARELCALIGRFREGCGPRWLVPGSAHLVGSCRMGMSAGSSVVDTCGRVRGFENLYVASNGVITSRLAVNPTLTAAALAVRTADDILTW